MSEKGCFIRVGSASEPMNTTMIEDLFSKRTRNSLGKIVSNRQDLTFEQLKIYYEAQSRPLKGQFSRTLELVTKENEFNYVAYLVADENGTSIKVAKYAGLDRADLIESNEYGYCSLVKATKAVLEKLEIENKTSTKITSKERIEKRLWNPIAVREAVINAIIHNDYTREVPPKFEIFPDRLEITSYGGLFEGMTQEDFFSGLSLPRNKELMRVFKDLDMVEQLGSGVPRILLSYSQDCFIFSDSFLRISIPRTIQESVDTHEYLSTHEDILGLFGSLSERLEVDATKNIALLNENYTLVFTYLNDNFGIISGKLRDSFGIASGKLRDETGVTSGIKLPKPVLTLFLILIYPEINLNQIAEILGVSSRSVESYIHKLRNEDFIYREGTRKEGQWRIVDKK